MENSPEEKEIRRKTKARDSKRGESCPRCRSSRVGLNGVVPQGPVNLIFFGKKVFADVIKLR